MSIIKNGKVVAGNNKISITNDATSETRGLIRIATDEEAELGIAENIAINPKQLANFASAGEVDLSGYYTKEEIDSKIGDINSILDEINGEEV